jgi:hypothetical protein
MQASCSAGSVRRGKVSSRGGACRSLVNHEFSVVCEFFPGLELLRGMMARFAKLVAEDRSSHNEVLFTFRIYRAKIAIEQRLQIFEYAKHFNSSASQFGNEVVERGLNVCSASISRNKFDREQQDLGLSLGFSITSRHALANLPPGNQVRRAFSTLAVVTIWPVWRWV